MISKAFSSNGNAGVVSFTFHNANKMAADAETAFTESMFGIVFVNKCKS